MKFPLVDYIDEYIKEADDNNKAVAQHLREIIPQTTHLNQEIFKEIIEKLKKEMDNGSNFKVAFHEVCEKYILEGDIIEAELPGLFTRIIVNKRLFIRYLSKRLGMKVKDIEHRIDANDVNRSIRLIGHLELAPPNSNVVFATFDEQDMVNDPFSNHKVKDIISMIGKDRSSFNEGEPLSLVKIRYKNKPNIEKKFPIFLDAGWYDKFYPAKKNDKYGRTKSLDPSLKNMPEIVHQNLTISEVTEDIRFLEDKGRES
jgi:hypothetical protein